MEPVDQDTMPASTRQMSEVPKEPHCTLGQFFCAVGQDRLRRRAYTSAPPSTARWTSMVLRVFRDTKFYQSIIRTVDQMDQADTGDAVDTDFVSGRVEVRVFERLAVCEGTTACMSGGIRAPHAEAHFHRGPQRFVPRSAPTSGESCIASCEPVRIAANRSRKFPPHVSRKFYAASFVR